MNDVSANTERRFFDLMMARSGEERVTMACRMFGTAKKLIVAGLRDRGVQDAREIRRGLFIALYGQDETPERLERIIAYLDTNSPS